MTQILRDTSDTFFFNDPEDDNTGTTYGGHDDGTSASDDGEKKNLDVTITFMCIFEEIVVENNSDPGDLII